MLIKQPTNHLAPILFSLFFSLLLTPFATQAEEDVFQFGRLELRNNTNYKQFLEAARQSEKKNDLKPSDEAELEALFKHYDFDGNRQLSGLEMTIGCKLPLTEEQEKLVARKKKKKGGGGGEKPPTACHGTCDCDHIGGGLTAPLDQAGIEEYGSSGSDTGFIGTNQNCFAADDANCHCHCNTHVCAPGGT